MKLERKVGFLVLSTKTGGCFRYGAFAVGHVSYKQPSFNKHKRRTRMSITQHDWILVRSQFISLRLLNIALISCRKILMCIFVVAAATTTAAATISIVNGSFEADVFNAARDGSSLDLGGTNPLTGWTTLHNGIYPWGLQNTNGYRAGPTPFGNQWVVVGDYGHGGTWIQQAVTGFTIGKTYELSFALATEQGRGALAEVSFPTGSNTLAQVFTAPLRASTYWDKWGTFTMPFIALTPP